jgi:ribonuclease HI
MRTLRIYVDGASSGNPGDAGYGFVIKDDEDREIAKSSGYIGRITCNMAEYTALILALREAVKLKPDSIEILTDSQLMAEQISGRYRVNSETLKPLYEKVCSLLDLFPNFVVKRIPRSQNKEADRLATRAIKEYRRRTGGEG